MHNGNRIIKITKEKDTAGLIVYDYSLTFFQAIGTQTYEKSKMRLLRLQTYDRSKMRIPRSRHKQQKTTLLTR